MTNLTNAEIARLRRIENNIQVLLDLWQDQFGISEETSERIQ